MPKNTYKKPTPEQFQQIAEVAGGNLSTVARSLKVSRGSITEWVKTDPEFKRIVQEERRKLFDEALATARLLMIGLPAYEIDENGKKKFAGWIERPSEGMTKYILSKLGREEGFGDEPVDVNLSVKKGVSIRRWIEKENAGEE
jgi:hypothetical protein